MHWSSTFTHGFDLDACCVYIPRCIGRPGVAAFEGVAMGSAYGPGAVADAAISEYVERRHFRHRVRQTGPRCLAQMDPPEYLLQACYRQVRRSSEVKIPDALPGCPVLRWMDWAPAHLPRNLIGLGGGEAPWEFELNPWRDSMAMACHRGDPQAIEAAVLEFVERQTTLAWWLGACTVRRIDQDLVARLAGHRATETRWEALWLDAGLGACTVLAAGESRDGGFCATAARLDPCDALSKALQEADHFRAFLGQKRQAAVLGRVASRYERFAVESGGHGMPGRIRQGLAQAPVLGAGAFGQLPAQTLSQVRERILDVSAHVYLYLAQESGKFGQHSLARLVSPDFYLHSDPGANLNFDNAFSVRLGIAQPAMCHRTPTCLP
jgi:ribosomal protein S12 methylthiotransferase accessory factor YcaO